MKKKSIRQLKRGIRNFAKTEGNSLEDKCEIINKLLFKDKQYYLSPKDLIEFLEEDCKDTWNVRNSEYGTEACEHLISVLSFLLGDSDKKPKSMAVYDPAETISEVTDPLILRGIKPAFDINKMIEEVLENAVRDYFDSNPDADLENPDSDSNWELCVDDVRAAYATGDTGVWYHGNGLWSWGDCSPEQMLIGNDTQIDYDDENNGDAYEVIDNILRETWSEDIGSVFNKVCEELSKKKKRTNEEKNFSSRRHVHSRKSEPSSRIDESNDAGKSDEQLLTEKCEIINREFFGDDQKKWQNPEDLENIILQMMRYEVDAEGTDTTTFKALHQVSDVLSYLADMNDSDERPSSLAVAEPLKRAGEDLQELLRLVMNAKKGKKYDYNKFAEEFARDYIEEAFEEAENKQDEEFIKKALDDAKAGRMMEDFRMEVEDAARETGGEGDSMSCLAGNEDDPVIRELWFSYGDMFLYDPATLDAEIRAYKAESATERAFYDIRDKYVKKWKKLGDKLFAPTLDTFCKAIKSGDVDRVAKLIERGGDVNISEDGHTPLKEAIEDGEPDIVKLLIENGAKVEKGRKGLSPLRIAINKGDYGIYRETIELLLEHGADINAPEADYDGCTPLMISAYRGQTDLVKLLLDNGANPNVKYIPPKTPDYLKEYSGWTALDFAKNKKHTDVVKVLEEATK